MREKEFTLYLTKYYRKGNSQKPLGKRSIMSIISRVRTIEKITNMNIDNILTGEIKVLEKFFLQYHRQMNFSNNSNSYYSAIKRYNTFISIMK